VYDVFECGCVQHPSIEFFTRMLNADRTCSWLLCEGEKKGREERERRAGRRCDSERETELDWSVALSADEQR